MPLVRPSPLNSGWNTAPRAGDSQKVTAVVAHEELAVLVRVLADGGGVLVRDRPADVVVAAQVRAQAFPAGVGGIDRSVCTSSAARRLGRALQSSTISELL